MSGRIGIALSIAGALLAVALVARSANNAPPSPVEYANLAFTLTDMSGSKVDLSTFAGKPLVINLWATWCGPCRLEMPQLTGFADKFRDRGLRIVGISTDDTPEAIREFAAEYKVNFPMLVGLGEDAFLRAIGYEDTLPLSILIRADGTIAERIRGIKTTDDWERRILALF